MDIPESSFHSMEIPEPAPSYLPDDGFMRQRKISRLLGQYVA